MGQSWDDGTADGWGDADAGGGSVGRHRAGWTDEAPSAHATTLLDDLSRERYAGGDALLAGGGLPPQERRPRRHGRWRRRLLIALSILLVLAVGLVGSAYFTFRHLQAKYDHNITKIGDPFQGIAQRPAAGKAGAMNILLLGSDSRISAGDATDWKPGLQRTDAIMVLHLDSDRKSAYVISIPRDSWVQIPGRKMAKINAGFSFGGPKLMVQTVESYTHLRIDHVAIIDFDGFKNVTDALGGVQITVPRSTKDKFGVEFKAGTYSMDGETALKYVRQRYGLAGGDFDRERRQQNWIRAIVHKMMSRGTMLSNPLAYNDALDALTKNVATDNAFTIDTMTSIGVSYATAGEGGLKFFMAPVGNAGARSSDGQAIVLLDQLKNDSLWAAVKADKVADWVGTNQPSLLGRSVS